MATTVRSVLMVVTIVAICATGCADPTEPSPPGESTWQDEFGLSDCTLVSTGRNQYFVLEPGFQLVLEGTSLLGKDEKLVLCGGSDALVTG